MLAWSEELITDVRKQKSWLWRHCRRRAVASYSDHPRKLVTLNPKLKSTGAGRYQLLSVGGMPTASSLAWKTSLRKVRTLWHCSRLRSVALYLWLIVVISVRQSTVAADIWASLPGAGYGQFEHKADSLIAKFKEAGGTVREIDMSRVTAIISLWLSASSSACHGLLIITVITPLPTKPSATKMPENFILRRTRQLLTCRCVSVMLLRSMQNNEELADAKAENDARVAAGRRRLHIKAVIGISAWSRHRLRRGWLTSPRLADAAGGIISPSEGWSLCKNNWRNRKYINEQCRWSCPYRWATHFNVSTIHTLPAEYKCLKPAIDNPFTNVCWVSVLTTFSAPPQILAASTVFFCPIQKRRNDGWWFPLVLLLRFVLNSKRLLSTSCNKQGQRSSE